MSLQDLPIHVYYDNNFINNKLDDTEPISITINDSRNSPFLQLPKLYQLSVVRFQMDSSLPVFIPQIQKNQGNPNLTIYSITLKYKTFEFQKFIEYEPTDANIPVPISINGSYQSNPSSNEYYFIYTIQRWIYLLNQAFSDAMVGLNAAVIAGADLLPIPVGNVPFMEVDPDSYDFTLNSDINATITVNPIEIYFNSSLYSLFSGFQYKKELFSAINGKDYKFDIYPTGLTSDPNNAFKINNTYTSLQMFSEGDSTAANMNPVQSIVFTTNLIPVRVQNQGVPVLFGSNTENFESGGNNAGINPIITDFTVPYSASARNTYRPVINYEPSELRFIDLLSISPLSTVQVDVFWKDRFNILHTFRLRPQQSFSIKLLFRRIDYYNITLPN